MTLTTVFYGNNADMIAAVSQFYIKNGAVVADVTYGMGAFWKKTDTSRFILKATDLVTLRGENRCDFRKLPYADLSIDVVVFDPPYTHNPGNHMTDARYKNKRTSKGMYHDDIMREFYKKGITEAVRVIKADGGQLWVKCKDEIESGVQRWSHIEIYRLGIEAGLFARDLFVVVPSSVTSAARWKNQYHARKTHSYLWVMEKPGRLYRKQLMRSGIIS